MKFSLILYLIFVLFIFLLFILFLLFMLITFFKSKKVPFVPSSRKATKKIVDYIARNFPNKDNIKIVDLGCGDGRIVFELAKLGYWVDGYELNPFLIFLLNIQRFFLKNKMKINFYKKDFLKEDLSKYDIFITYLFPHVMAEIENKIQNFKKEFFLISNSFPLPNKQPLEKIGNIYIYKF